MRLRTWLALCIALVAMLPAAAQASTGAQQRAEQALQHVKDLKHGIGVHTGREMTPALLELERTRVDLTPSGRKEADSILARPTDGASDPQGDGYTTAEATPFCTVHFCIHYVTSTADAPPLADNDLSGVPDYVEQMASVFEDEVFPCENGSAVDGCDQGLTPSPGLGWPQAPSDGTRGGDARFDIYLKQLCADPSACLFGYVAPDPQPASSSLFSYLVLDNDFAQSEFGYPDPLLPTQVTAAHEYNHVLQFGIDANEDTWMFESTATYMEDKVYPLDDDYLNYMPDWVNLTAQPITEFASDNKNTTVREDLKVYGSAVWNHFVAGRHGDATILNAWQAKTQVVGSHTFAPASYNTAIVAHGGTGFSDEFDDFSAAVAEWRVPGSGFPDTYPDVPASERPNMTVGAPATSISLDHTTFAFRNIPVPASSTTLTLHATLPAGLKGAVALVGRTGNSTTAGTVTTAIQRLSSGGAATVSLPNADTFGRITAVLVNSDTTQSGFNNGQQDWSWSKDGQSFTGVQVTSGVAPPGPVVSTDAASGVTLTAATLNGHVNPGGVSTTYFFEYGTTTSYGSQTPLVAASAGSGSSSLAFSAPATGLTRGTTYHYRIVASNANGTTQGSDATFTTLDPPIVSTDAPTGVAVDGATLNASVDPRGKATTYFFQYGPTVAYGNQIPLVPDSAGSGTGAVPVSQALTGLAQGTTIHYRVVATNADGTTNGGDQSFKTLDPPFVTNESAGSITTTGAVLAGTVDPRAQATTFVFEYGTTTAYGNQVSGSAGNSSGAVSVATQISGLDPGTLYHFRLSASNAGGTTVGGDATFTTATAASGQPSPSPSGSGSEPAPAPPDAGAGTVASRLTLAVAIVKAKLSAVLKKGLRVRPTCSEACSVTAKLTLSKKVAKKLRIKPTIGTARGRGGATLRIRIGKKAARALRRLRKVATTLVVTATTPDGRKTTLKKSVSLRR